MNIINKTLKDHIQDYSNIIKTNYGITSSQFNLFNQLSNSPGKPWTISCNGDENDPTNYNFIVDGSNIDWHGISVQDDENNIMMSNISSTVDFINYIQSINNITGLIGPQGEQGPDGIRGIPGARGKETKTSKTYHYDPTANYINESSLNPNLWKTLWQDGDNYIKVNIEEKGHVVGVQIKDGNDINTKTLKQLYELSIN